MIVVIDREEAITYEVGSQDELVDALSTTTTPASTTNGFLDIAAEDGLEPGPDSAEHDARRLFSRERAEHAACQHRRPGPGVAVTTGDHRLAFGSKRTLLRRVPADHQTPRRQWIASDQERA